jgi:hypothetical protein
MQPLLYGSMDSKISKTGFKIRKFEFEICPDLSLEVPGEETALVILIVTWTCP